ncbi:MAG: zf-HC2 domain-containing protein [Thermodesulfobacteriota bacterium]
MNCTDCQDQFSDFIDDEISLKMARSFKGHLASCPACSAELQLFQQTLDTLHAFPAQKVPADFVIGINEKLAPQPFAKLQGWFSFISQHKLTAGSALATLVVGVISAAVLQLSPVDSEQILAKNGIGSNNMQAMTVDADKDHINYYPGIPYLAQKSQDSKLPKPRAQVQFTSVKQSTPNGGHNSLLDSRGPPNMSYPSAPHPSLSHFGTTSPDLVVTVHSKSTAYQHALIRQLTANHQWKTQINGNSLLITLPYSQLADFQHLFGPVDPHINTNELSHLNNSSSSRLLTVVVAFH